MTTSNFILEIGTEELPPKALNKLTEALSQNLQNHLNTAEITFGSVTELCTPRRMAVLIQDMALTQKDKAIEKKGPNIKAAFAEDGTPSKAALGFARSCNVDINDLTKKLIGKNEHLYFSSQQKGKPTKELLIEIATNALKKLPIPKLMRWGDNEFSFVRPVHWILLMLGEDVITGEILGCKTGNTTYGHRFHHPEAINIKCSYDYQDKLTEAKVITDVDTRQMAISQQMEMLANSKNAAVVLDQQLLEEAANLVEWPNAILCEFDKRFLTLPKEVIVSSLKKHQKCFLLQDETGKLLNNFIAISNIKSKNPTTVIKGNEKVVAARLSDAEFFYKTDLKTKLSEHLAGLKNLTFQAKLGSVYDKSQRIALLAKDIAKQLKLDPHTAESAAMLAKTDLMTEMVMEFPELQGIIGEYYAKHQQEPHEVASAINQHYKPRFASDSLPNSNIAACVAIADKVDTIVGIFGIGKKPTGTKDPYALRRAMIGVLRIIIEKQLNLDLTTLIETSITNYNNLIQQKDLKESILSFAFDRLKVLYQEKGINHGIFDAVLAVRTTALVDFDARIKAIEIFSKLAESADLTAINKRVSNILTKNNIKTNNITVDKNKFSEKEEIALFDALTKTNTLVSQYMQKHEYQMVLTELTKLQEVIETFFKNVMVMCDDKEIRTNRLNLLAELQTTFMQVADISKLSI